MITTKDIAWLAGLLEGEGNFRMHLDTSPRIKLTMTDEDVIAKARNMMHPYAKITIYQPKNNSYKVNYQFVVCGALGISWMMTLYPLMGRRRKEKIREVIAAWKLVPFCAHTAARIENRKNNIGNKQYGETIRERKELKAWVKEMIRERQNSKVVN